MATTNINEAYHDVGMVFPIQLSNGGWYPKQDGMDLIKQNLTALILYEIGFRIRQEDFGTRLWECLEEPNTQALNFLIYEFLKEAILKYESRIEIVKAITTRNMDKLNIELHYKLAENSSENILGIEYNL